MLRRRRSRGASTVEWVIIVMIIGVAGIGAFQAFRGRIASTAEQAGDCILNAEGSCSGAAATVQADACGAGQVVRGSDAALLGTMASGPTTPASLRASLASGRGDPLALLSTLYSPVGTFAQTREARLGLLGLVDRLGGWIGEAAEWGIDGVGRWPAPLRVMAFGPLGLALDRPEVRSFVKGLVVDFAGGTIMGLVHLALDPEGAVEGLGKLATSLVTDPGGTAGAIWTQITEAWSRDPWRFSGALTGEVASFFLPTKASKAATAAEVADEVGDAARLARRGDEVADAGRLVAHDVRCGGGVCTGLGNCFPAGTPIDTADGPRAIEDLAVGTLVWATPPDGGAPVLRPVVDRFARRAAGLVRLTVEDEAGARAVIDATPEHPFFVNHAGFVAAGALRPGVDALRDRAGRPLALVAAEALPVETAVYNVEVAELHTYHVGALGLLAHNACRVPGPPEPPSQPLGKLLPDWKEESPSTIEKLTNLAGRPVTRVTPRDPVLSMPDFSHLTPTRRLGGGFMKVAYDAGDEVMLFMRDPKDVSALLGEAEALADFRRAGVPAVDLKVGYWKGHPVGVEEKFLPGTFSREAALDPRVITPEYIQQVKDLRQALRDSGLYTPDVQWAAFKGPDGNPIVKLIDTRNATQYRGGPVGAATRAFTEKVFDDYLKKAEQTAYPSVRYPTGPEVAEATRAAREGEPWYRRFFSPGSAVAPSDEAAMWYASPAAAREGVGQRIAELERAHGPIQRYEAQLVTADLVTTGSNSIITHSEWQIFAIQDGVDPALVVRTNGSSVVGAFHDVPGWGRQGAPGVQVQNRVPVTRGEIDRAIDHSYFKGEYLKDGWVCHQVSVEVGRALGIPVEDTARRVPGLWGSRTVLGMGRTGKPKSWPDVPDDPSLPPRR